MVRIDGLSPAEIVNAFLEAGISPSAISNLDISAIAKNNKVSVVGTFAPESPSINSLYTGMSCQLGHHASTLLAMGQGAFNNRFQYRHTSGYVAYFDQAGFCPDVLGCSFFHFAGDQNARILSHSAQGYGISYWSYPTCYWVP